MKKSIKLILLNITFANCFLLESMQKLIQIPEVEVYQTGEEFYNACVNRNATKIIPVGPIINTDFIFPAYLGNQLTMICASFAYHKNLLDRRLVFAFADALYSDLCYNAEAKTFHLKTATSPVKTQEVVQCKAYPLDMNTMQLMALWIRIRQQ